MTSFCEGLNNLEIIRMREQRRTQLRVLTLETQLIEDEVRRLRSSPTSTSTYHQSSILLSESRRSLHAPSPVGSLLSLNDTLSPRPMSRRNSRRSSSSAERNTGRLPRAIMQQLIERATQETQRQLEALKLKDINLKKQLLMQKESIKKQIELLRMVSDDLKQNVKFNKDTLERWETKEWIGNTERELHRIKLQLLNYKKRESKDNSEVDLQLLESYIQRNQDEVDILRKLLNNGNNEIPLITINNKEKEEYIINLKKEVAEWHARSSIKQGQLLSLHKRNQRIARCAIALEQKEHCNTNLQVITEFACLRRREKSLKHELDGWERRKYLLRKQIKRSKHNNKQEISGGVAAPHTSPINNNHINSTSNDDNDQ